MTTNLFIDDFIVEWILTLLYNDNWRLHIWMINDYIYVLQKLNKKYKNKIKRNKIKNQNKKRL